MHKSVLKPTQLIAAQAISLLFLMGCSSANNTDPTTGTDPMVQSTTLVTFNIEVPAYQSDELQVLLSWGDKNLQAKWIGDEFWEASDDFPTDTARLLTVTFYDANGDIPLASVEQAFRTGTKTRILLFSETRGFRHNSIADALKALDELSTAEGIRVDQASDSAGVFTETSLAQYDAVVWALTSGDVLDTDEQTAFEAYIRAGGGYVGIHAASDTEYDWPWYGALVGAYFDRHPAVQAATQFVENASHPSTKHLNTTWTRTDEWYDFRSNPRSQVNVLLRLDESSYTGGGMGDDHPSAWYHNYDGGRSWYTGGGHTSASYAEEDFRRHLLGGIRYATGLDAP